MAQIYTINAQGQYVLPIAIPGLSDQMATLFAQYLDSFNSFDAADPDRLHRVTERLRDFAPTSLPDFAAKVLLGVHYTDPECDGDHLAIEPDLRDNHVAAQILLSCVGNLIDLSGPKADSADAWDRALSARQAADARLNDATIAYGEVEFGDDVKAIARANALLDEAAEADRNAIGIMMATPVARLADLVFKVDEAVANLREDHIASVKADILRFARGETRHG